MINIYCFHGCGQNPTIFKSLLKSLQKNLKESDGFVWNYMKGNYFKKHEGFGWYDYNSTDIINQDNRHRDLTNIIDKIQNPEYCIFIGFSEGGQFALDLAQYIPTLRGVVSISPAYKHDIKTNIISCPVILITSINDDKISKRYFNKWKKVIVNMREITHTKGHKVYLPQKTRQIIRDVFRI